MNLVFTGSSATRRPTTASSGLTSPAGISNLFLWLDANDSSTITNNAGYCDQINDKSGYNRHFVKAFTTGPQILTTAQAQGGKNSLYVSAVANGTNIQVLKGNSTAANDFWNMTGNFSIFAVYYSRNQVPDGGTIADVQPWFTVLSQANNSNNNPWRRKNQLSLQTSYSYSIPYGSAFYNNPQMQVLNGPQDANNITYTGGNWTTGRIVGTVATTTGNTFYVNRNPYPVTSNALSLGTPLGTSRDITIGYSWFGYIAETLNTNIELSELVVYNKNLSSSEVTSLTDYFNTKYSLGV